MIPAAACRCCPLAAGVTACRPLPAPSCCSSAQLWRAGGMTAQIRFRHTYGDVGPFTFDANTPVAALKQRLLDEWPTGELRWLGRRMCVGWLVRCHPASQC